MHDGIYGNGGGGQGPPSVGSGRQSYTHQGLFFICFVLFYIVLFCIVVGICIILHNFIDNIMKKVSIKKSLHILRWQRIFVYTEKFMMFKEFHTTFGNIHN